MTETVVLKHRSSRNPFVGFEQLTLADVLARLAVEPSLAPVRRRDLASAVRRVAQLLERNPSMIPADLRELKTPLGRLVPAQIDVSGKTLANLRSNLATALRLAGAHRSPSTRRVRLSREWQALSAALPDKRMKNGLSRFLRFCAVSGIAADRVDDATVDDFVAAVEAGTFVTDLREVRRRTTRLWNEAAENIRIWPRQRLTVPDQRNPRESLPLVAFRAEFRDEVERYLAWLRDEDPFAEHRPPHPCRPTTIRQARMQIELAASALIRAGRDIATITALADVVEVEAVKTILRHYHEKAGGSGSAFARRMATMLVSIGRHWLRAGPDHVERLKDLRRRLGPERTGLTEKNRTALRQFDDDDNRRRLLLLPEHLFREALDRDDGSVRHAVRAQIAFAIEILLNCPVRMQNLISLRLDRHIVRPGGPKGPVFLVLPPEEVKNLEPVEYELPRHLVAMLDTYVHRFRPRLASSGSASNPYLFPSKGAARKAQGTLAQQIGSTIRKRTGLVLSPHQFRHLAAKLFLERRPGNYEALRRVLNHRNMKTTSSFYAGLQTAPAAKLYDDLLLEERERLRAMDEPSRRRVRDRITDAPHRPMTRRLAGRHRSRPPRS